MNKFDNLPYFLDFWGYLNILKKTSWEAHGFHNCYWNVFDTTTFPKQKMGEDHAKGKKVVWGNMIANPYQDNHKGKDTL